MGYTLIGVMLAALFLLLSPSIEAPSSSEAISIQRRFGLHKSKKVVFKLSSLFALDAFAGGLVVQSMVAYWFNMKFGVQPAVLGGIFFAANILAGISALSAAWIAKRIGLINTMVYTHIPSNILLILVPFMPTLPLAVIALLLRFSISQMDVPTRQSYTMAVVSPDERSAAMGVTSIARSLGAMLSPAITGQFLAVTNLIGAPFVIAGSLKIVYDVLIWRGLGCQATGGTMSLTFRWLGVAGVELKAGEQVIAIDPFFTRPSLQGFLKPVIPDEQLIYEKLPLCHFVLVTHSHWDHLMDVPGVLQRTGAVAHGSANTCQLLHLLGVPDIQVKEIQVGDKLSLGAFEVQVIEGQHSWIPFSRWLNGRLPPGLQPPLRLQDYRMDVCLGYKIQVSGMRVLLCAAKSQPAEVLFIVAQESKGLLSRFIPGSSSAYHRADLLG